MIKTFKHLRFMLVMLLATLGVNVAFGETVKFSATANSATTMAATVGTVSVNSASSQSYSGAIKLNSSGYILCTPASGMSFAAGDEIVVTCYNQASSGKLMGFKLHSTSDASRTLSENTAAKTNAPVSYTLTAGDIESDGTIKVFRHSSDAWFVSVVVTAAEASCTEPVKVIFNAGEGTGSMDDDEACKGKEYTIPACGFTAPAGKEFDAWTSSDVTITDGKFTPASTSDVRLTATWKDLPAAPDFVFTKTGKPTSGNLAAGDEIAVTGGTMKVYSTKTETSLKWASDGLNFSGGQADQVIIETDKVFQVGSVISLTFKNNSLDILDESGKLVATQAAPGTTYTVAAGDGLAGNNVFRLRRNGSSYLQSIEITGLGSAVATWNVTFDMQEATSAAIEAQSVKNGKKAVKPEDPTKTGFDFVNWIVKDSDPEAVYDFDDAVTADVALIAKWTAAAVKHTVRFFDGAEQIGEDVLVNDGEKVTRPADPIKVGYHVAGWKNAEVDYDFDAAVTEDLNLTVNWSDPVYAQDVDFEVAAIAGTPSPQDVMSANGYWYGGGATTWDNNTSTNNGSYLGLKMKEANSTVEFLAEANKMLVLKVGILDASKSEMYQNGVKVAENMQGGSKTTGDNFKLYYFHSDADAQYMFKTTANNAQIIKAISFVDPYTVTFTVPAGAEAVAPMTFKAVALTLPAAEKGTDEFLGWFDAAEGGNEIGKAGETYTPAGNVELFAQFSTCSTNNEITSFTYGETTVTATEGKREYAIELPYKSEIPATLTYESESATKGDVAKADNVFTFTVTNECGEAADYTITFTVAPKDGVCLIEAALTSNTAATVTGVIGGTADVNVTSGTYKMDKGKYIGVALANDGKFQAGDVVVINVIDKQNATGFALYTEKEGTNLIIDTRDGNVIENGEYSITLPVEYAGSNAIYAVRLNNSETGNLNACVNNMKVYRAMNPMLKALTVAGVDAEIDEDAKTIAVALPNGTNPAEAVLVPTIIANGGEPTAALDGTLAYNTAINYVLTDKDGDQTTYVLTATEAAHFVAKIGTHGYETLDAAIAAAQDDEVVTLLENITLTAALKIGASDAKHARHFTIDLGGFTVTKASGAMFTIYDDVTLKKGNIEYHGAGMSAWAISTYGNVTIDGVNITDLTNNAGYIVTVKADATFTLKDGTIKSDKPRGGIVSVANGAAFVMEGGELISNYNAANSSAACVNVAVGGTATVNAGTLTAAMVAVWVDGTADLKGGVYTAPYTIWVNKGTANISAGEYKAAPTAVYLYTATAKANITGGDFQATGTNKSLLLNKLDAVSADAVFDVTGGTYHDGFDPSNNAAEGTATDFCPQGYVGEELGEGVFGVKEAETDATLNTLTVNGNAIALVADQFEYAYELPYGTTEVPVVAATNDKNATIEITQLTATTGTATIKVTSEDRYTVNTYVVDITVALYKSVVIFDGSTMSAVATSPDASGLAWSVTGFGSVANYSASCAGKDYTKTLPSGGNGSDSRYFEVVVPANHVARFYTVFGSHSSDSRSFSIGTSKAKEIETGIYSATSTGRAALVAGYSEWVEAGTYYIKPNASVDFYEVRVQLQAVDPKCEAPVITTQPETNKQFGAGAMTATVVASVEDGGELSYQWYNEADEAVVGATAATLSTETEGKYYVIITNTLAGHRDNSVKSEVAELAHRVMNDATLSALKHGETAIALVADQYEYNVVLAKGTTDVPALSATTNSDYATKVINDAEAFVDYAATSTVVVTAEDGVATQTYTVNFTVKHDVDLQPVTASAVWDWKAGVTTNQKAVGNFTDAVLANVEGVVYADAFHAEQIQFTGTWGARHEGTNTDAYRYYMQATQFKMNFAVAGKLVIYYRGTGTDKPATVIVNGETVADAAEGVGSKYEAAYPYAVEPGMVTVDLIGENNGPVRICKIEFTTATVEAAEDAHPVTTVDAIATLCSEKDIVAHSGGAFYYVSANNDGALELTEATGVLHAGYPYIYISNGQPVKVVYGDGVATEPKNHNGLYATFENLPLGDGYAIIVNNKYYRTHDGNNNGCYAYHCYIKLDEIAPEAMEATAPGEDAPAPVHARRVVLGTNETTVATGIDAIEMTEDVQKILMDGVVYIIRGGKLYNVAGQIVK